MRNNASQRVNLKLYGISVVLILLSLSCSVKRAPQFADFPESFSVQGEQELPEQWWKSFNDPQLDTLIAQAITHNFTVLSAWDRIAQAAALYGIASSELWPTLTFGFGGSDFELVGEEESSSFSSSQGGFSGGSNASSGGVGAQYGSVEGHQYNLLLNASYEVDLWGRVRRASRAALADFIATSEDVKAAILSISALVSRTWFELLAAREQLALNRQQVQVNKDYLSLMEQRFKQGQVSAADVLLQQQQLAAVEGETPLLESQVKILENELVVLLGRSPDARNKKGLIPSEGDFPPLPPAPSTGVPSHVLFNRPDVQAAFSRLKAADHRLSQAVAARFPKISFSVSGSDYETRPSELLRNWYLNLVWNITSPIFDAGRLKREVKRNEGLVSERYHAFAQTLVNAAKEVENALITEAHRKEYVKRVGDQVRLAKRTMEVNRNRYLTGGSDFISVLTALTRLQQLERTEISANKDLLNNRIDLYRALSGTWRIHGKEMPND